jgi:tryptophan synthase alpha chain
MKGVAAAGRIAVLFERLRAEKQLGLFTYLTVGYPDLKSTPGLVRAVAEAGADLVELGIPFSDPLAEGKTIQGTSQRALRNGVTVRFCLAVARECRALTNVPLVFMGYTNPILAFGMERFCEEAAAAGVDGLIVVDLSLEEAEELAGRCRANGLDLIFFAAPTSTEERIETVVQHATGFIYCIAVTGVTGSREQMGQDVEDLLARVRRHTDLPLALGFGISRPEHLRVLQGKVDAVLVGSALMDAIGKGQPEASASHFVRHLRGSG